MGSQRDREGKRELDTVETYDFWHAAYLIALGVPLVSVTGTRARFTRYEFANTDGAAERATHEWYRGQAPVNAREFARGYREAKRLSFEAEQAA